MIIRWDGPGPYVVAFSTRAGGVSEGPYESLNLGLLTDDEPDRVEENRRRLCAEVGADPERLALNLQVHGTVVNRAVAGRRGVPGDGLWTDEPGVPMLKVTADCLPIALARTNGTPALCLVHAGWRGLAEGVVEAGVAALDGPVAAMVGPGIGPCCYEVGPEVAELFGERGRRLDLRAAAERALRAAGVASVEHVDLCTSCDERFFSHRRYRGVTGRQGVVGFVQG
ncbi:MAG: polyphenol oxidase family protein [Gaiellaceae bacterium]